MPEDMKQRILAKLASVGPDIRLYTELQSFRWKWILELVAAEHRHTFPNARIQKTYWIPQLPDFTRKKCDFLVDLENGRLMSVESSVDFFSIGAPLAEVKPAPSELASLLGFCVDSFDAELVLQLARKSCAKPIGSSVTLYDAKGVYFGEVRLIFKK